VKLARAGWMALVVCAVACGRGDREWRRDLEAARAAKDAMFRGEDSPLPAARRSTFQGLRYFDPDPKWDVQAALDPAASADSVWLVTSKGTREPFTRVGRVVFRRGGRVHALVLFRSLPSDEFFLPFTDATSGHETYGAGRYVNPVPTPDGGLRLDFNRAYNPYCAYDASWVCPVPPAENHLDVRVRAGEKSVDAH
jgi:uncharacterized protein (DUF1684 family)